MKRGRALGASIAVVGALLVAACGDGGEPSLFDGGPPDACAIFNSSCNPIYQTGCAAGQKCELMHGPDGEPLRTCGDVHFACVPPGPVELGSACTVTDYWDDCDPSGFCHSGVCVAYCGRPDPQCTTGYCLYSGYGSICAQPCDPLASTCGSAEACQLGWGAERPGCAPPGPGAEGDACIAQYDCRPGLTCSGYPDPRCVVICAVGGGEPSCAADQTCIEWAPGTRYGACRSQL